MALRVAIVAPWGERLGGAEEMLWLALRHRDPERLAPSVVFLGPGGFEAEVAALGVPTAVIEAGRLRRPLATLGTIGRLARRLRRERPDLVLAWSAKAQAYCAPAATAAGIGDRVVWWQHQIPDRHWVDRVATLLPARAVGCSSEANRVGQGTLRPHRPAFVVNPGIEVATAGGGSAAGLREQLGIPAGRPVAGIVGRLQPWKGQHRFLAALAELRERGREVHGLLVGGDAWSRSPAYAAELERTVVRLGLSDRVTMTGQVTDARPYFELMDVAVNASEAEPFGIVLLEAMAAGPAVVAVGRGGPLDIVEDGTTGLLVPTGAPHELAAAIEQLLGDPARRKAISAAARLRCRERFGAKAMAARLTAELARVADA